MGTAKIRTFHIPSADPFNSRNIGWFCFRASGELLNVVVDIGLQ
jgi:hypothetical protein